MLANTDRRQIYLLLSYLFYYPDAETPEVVGGVHGENLQALLPDLASPPAVGKGDLDEVAGAYTALFVNRSGGVPAPPYGSVYLDDAEQLMDSSTRKVAQVYRNAGLEIEAGSEPADFLPIELEFLAHLVEQEDQALEQQSDALAAHTVELQRAFLGDLVLPWIAAFCARLQKSPGAHPLYLWSAELLVSFLATEKERLHL